MPSYPESLKIAPVHALSGTLDLPGSKSITNRALLLAALASGTTRLTNVLDSEDTTHMLTALEQLGIRIVRDGATHVVTGRGGPLVSTAIRHELYLGLAGTALRPLTAALTLGEGTFVVDGSERMRERPIGDLVDGLRQLGADVSYLGATGYPPLEIRGTGLDGGTVRMSGSVSSQFLTSLLLAAPLARGPVTVAVEGEQVSKPYLDITVQMMRRFGATVRHRDFEHFEVEPGGYRAPGDYLVEGDASSASYFLAGGAIRGAGMAVHGIGRDSLQGDVAFADVLEAMGARVTRMATRIEVRPPADGRLRAVDVDLNHIPDAAMTLAVLALFAEGRTCIRNIGNWRVKETDRLSAMATELGKLGATVEEGADYLCVTPPAVLREVAIDTYGDHRMAMCFSLVALAGTPVTIRDPACVAKTFPDYFERFAELSRTA